MDRFFKQFEKMPLTDEEWMGVKKYRRLPFSQKLELLDRVRLFMFEVWKKNPLLFKAYQKSKRLGF